MIIGTLVFAYWFTTHYWLPVLLPLLFVAALVQVRLFKG